MNLNLNLRGMVYSYLPFQDLIDSVCKLSKKDREELISSKIVDQTRNLLIKNAECINNGDILRYYIKLVNGNVVLKYTPDFKFPLVYCLLHFIIQE